MGQGAFSNTKQGFALGRSTVRTGIGIGIGIEIGSAGQTFDNDPPGLAPCCSAKT